MFLSHYRAGTGALLVETREESRLLRELLLELPPSAEVGFLVAPQGTLKDARTGTAHQGCAGLMSSYQWASAEPGRALIVLDFHTLVNSPLHWRALSEALPALRSPQGSGPEDPASLVVFVGPTWELTQQNPLRGTLPILRLPPPDREALRSALSSLQALPAENEGIIDAVCGLSCAAAEQAAAEVLARNNGELSPVMLREARREVLREGGLEIWPPVPEMGGLDTFQGFARSEVFPWVRDRQLSVRRILCAGLPGVGKSYCARWLAAQLGCECARLSIPALKAGLVGASEANLRRALSVLDALGADSPVVVVLDEIDTIARDGMDGGTSAGMFAELLTWLQESTSLALCVATLNRLDKLDAALESRFQARFFFDLPSAVERRQVAELHFNRLRCSGAEQSAEALASLTEGFSSREIAEQIIPSVARRTERKPDVDSISAVVKTLTPASVTQADQLKAMRSAAGSLTRANSETSAPTKQGRRRVV